MTDEPEYLLASEVLKMLKISRDRLRRLVAAGELTVGHNPAGRLLYRRADVEALAERRP